MVTFGLTAANLLGRVEHLSLERTEMTDDQTYALLATGTSLRHLSIEKQKLCGEFFYRLYLHTKLVSLRLIELDSLRMMELNRFLQCHPILESLELADETYSYALAVPIPLRFDCLQSLEWIKLNSTVEPLTDDLTPVVRLPHLQGMQLRLHSGTRLGELLASVPAGHPLQKLILQVADIRLSTLIGSQFAFHFPNVSRCIVFVGQGAKMVPEFLHGLSEMRKLRSLSVLFAYPKTEHRFDLMPSFWAHRLFQQVEELSAEIKAMPDLTHLAYMKNLRTLRVHVLCSGAISPKRAFASVRRLIAALAIENRVQLLHLRLPYSRTPFELDSAGEYSRLLKGWTALTHLKVQGHVQLRAMEALMGDLPNLQELVNSKADWNLATSEIRMRELRLINLTVRLRVDCDSDWTWE